MCCFFFFFSRAFCCSQSSVHNIKKKKCLWDAADFFFLNKHYICVGFFKQKFPHLSLPPASTWCFQCWVKQKVWGECSSVFSLCSKPSKKMKFCVSYLVVVLKLGKAGRGGGKDTARGHQSSAAAGSGGGCVLGRNCAETSCWADPAWSLLPLGFVASALGLKGFILTSAWC